jgi:fructose-1,6-bisphosphatase/inositol monophosphatase family enzyme
MISSDIYLKRMLSFVHEAGGIALDLIGHSDPGLKKDHSIITLADKAISKLARSKLNDFLQSPEHILIDEEDPAIVQYTDQKSLDKVPFIWALDPIDGTRLYANRMPLFGISIGLIKDLKPWLGAVYFPMLKELFYCDGHEAYYVKDAFGPNETKIRIVPIDEDLSARSLFFCNDTFFDKFYWNDKDFHIMINACAVVNLCWPAIGRGLFFALSFMGFRRFLADYPPSGDRSTTDFRWKGFRQARS